MQNFFQYYVVNLELILKNKIVNLNKQNASFDITLPYKIISNIIAVRQIQNSNI